MKRMFGPKNEHEELVFAIEELLADVQLSIQEAMAVRGVSRSELARRFGCSPANITQLLSEGANLKLETVARLLHHLDHVCEVRCRPIEQSERPSNERARCGRKAEAPRWTVWFRDKADEPPAEREKLATAELVMKIARNSAPPKPRQHVNGNVLHGQQAA